MQTWKFDLTTSSDVDIMDTIVGYVRYYERIAGGGTDPRIRLKSLGGGSINVELTPGEAYRLSQPVRGLVIENMSGVALSGKLAIAPDASAIDVGKLSGVVDVVDGEKSRTLAGGNLAGNPGITPTAGQYGSNQLWNPAASGKNLILQGMNFGSASGGAVLIYAQATALATDKTATNAANKKAGAALGVGQVRVESLAALPAFSPMQSYVLTANVNQAWNFRGPVVLPPGYGLNVTQLTVTNPITTNFEWFEEAVS